MHKTLQQDIHVTVAAHAEPTTRYVATGIGNSELPARLFVQLLSHEFGRHAVYWPVAEFLAQPKLRSSDVLVVFSQRLSPNVRLALAARAQAAHCIVVTALNAGEDAVLDAMEQEPAVDVVRFCDTGEGHTLLRVVGAFSGALTALRLAHVVSAQSHALGPLVQMTERLLMGSNADAEALRQALAGTLTLLAPGSYAELLDGARRRIVEGTLRPPPPAWELLGYAHGPFQENFGAPRTLVVLAPAGEASHACRGRLTMMAERAGHSVLWLQATTPAPYCWLEHEAIVTRALVGFADAHGVTLTQWPGQGADAPLYGLCERSLDGY